MRLARSSLALVAALVLGTALTASSCTRPPDSGNKPAAQKSKPKPKKKPKKPKKPKPRDPWLEDLVSKAEVKVELADGKSTPCTWSAGKKRHRCEGRPGWVWVGPTVQKVAGKDVACVWNHPTQDGKVITTIKGAAKEGLAFQHAFTGRAATLKGAKELTAVVSVDGKEVGKDTRPRKPGWGTVNIAPAKGAGDVTISVSSPNVGGAHYCWRLQKASDAAATPTTATPPGKPGAEPAKPAPKPEAKPAPKAEAKPAEGATK
jgi:hypothetical protein